MFEEVSLKFPFFAFFVRLHPFCSSCCWGEKIQLKSWRIALQTLSFCRHRHTSATFHNFPRVRKIWCAHQQCCPERETRNVFDNILLADECRKDWKLYEKYWQFSADVRGVVNKNSGILRSLVFIWNFTTYLTISLTYYLQKAHLNDLKQLF